MAFSKDIGKPKGNQVAVALNLFNEPETVIPKEKKRVRGVQQFGKYKTIPFFTNRNDFAQTLLALSEVSTTHRSCIYTKAEYEFKDGFGIVKGKNRSIIKTKTKEEQSVVSDEIIYMAEELLLSVNGKGESLSEICKQLRINLNTSGNGWIEVAKGDVLGEKFIHIYNHDFTNVLFVDPGKEESDVSEVYVSVDWSDAFLRTNEPVKLPLYPKWEEVNGAERTMIHVKEYSIGRDYYGLPLFIAAKIPSQLEYESDRHNIERFFSDFMPKFFAGFFAPDGMTPEKKTAFYQDFYNTYTKKGREGQISAMVQVFESDNMKPFFHEFGQNNTEGDFMNLKSGSRDSIFTAHRWHPVLAAVPIASGLNDSKQIQNIFSIYNEIAIKPNQKFDLEKVINPIFKMMAEWLSLPLKDYQLTLETSSPISFFNDLDVNSLLKVDEGRAYLGEDKLGGEIGEKMISQIQKGQIQINADNAN